MDAIIDLIDNKQESSKLKYKHVEELERLYGG
jgi:hypothetical protein